MNQHILAAAAAAGLLSVVPPPAAADPVANNALVRHAITELFVKRDTGAVAKYWQEPYIQHNPTIPNGTTGLADAVRHLPASFTYEPGFSVAQGDLVMMHGRYTGFGPKPQVAVDIFRLKHGEIVEHWDVLQNDVPASQTKSGNPMFSPDEAARNER